MRAEGKAMGNPRHDGRGGAARTFGREPSPSSPEPALSHGFVLIVDDEPAVRTMLGRLLRVYGFKTREADGADTAIEIARSERIDLVVTDVVMPGRSGIDLRYELAAYDPSLPVILISGFSPDAPAEVAHTIPLTRFMQKPFAVDRLVAEIGEMLSRDGGEPQGLTSTG